MNTIPFAIVYQGMLLSGYANPIETLEGNALPSMIIYIQGWCMGTLHCIDEKWSMEQPIDPQFVADLGNHIHSHIRSIAKAMDNGKKQTDMLMGRRTP